MSSPITYPIDAHHLLRKKRAIRRELLAHGELVDKRIAILGGSTTAEVKDMLELFLLEAGIRPEFYESEFNRYTEDILFPESGLQQFRPEFIYLHTSNLNLSGYPSPGDDEREVDALLASELARFEALWQRIDEDHGCPVIQNNFELPLYRGLGNLDASAVAGHTRFTAELNARFAAAARQRPNLQLNDIHYLSAGLGLDSW
ncbi:MAG: hypothetical protein Q8L92_05875, partial [Rubrivivax sp.]|nr:hypothetical protein [Rubrivivax sp.]